MSIKFLAMCIALIGAFFSVFSAELNEVKNWKPIGAIVMHPFFQGRHYVEAVKKCKFHFLRVLYTARSSFMQQTPETIFRIHKASCSLAACRT